MILNLKAERLDGSMTMRTDKTTTLPLITTMFLACAGCNEQKFQHFDPPAIACNDTAIRSLKSTDAYTLIIPECQNQTIRACIEPSAVQHIAPPTKLPQIEILFLVDTTGSMGGAIKNVKDNLETLSNYLYDVGGIVKFGVASFRDSPLEGGSGRFTQIYHTESGGKAYDYNYNYAGDLPYELKQPLTDDIRQVISTFESLKAEGGGDGKETMIEALYQAATGEGLKHIGVPMKQRCGESGIPGSSYYSKWCMDSKNTDPGAEKTEIIDVQPSPVGWSSTRTTEAVARYIYVVTDYSTKTLSFGHTREQALKALNDQGIMVIGMGSKTEYYPGYECLPSVGCKPTGTPTSALSDIADFTRSTKIFVKSPVLNLNPGDPFTFTMNYDGTIANSKSAQPIADAMLEAVRQTLPYQIQFQLQDDQHRILSDQWEVQIQNGDTESNCMTLRSKWTSNHGERESSVIVKLHEKTSDSTIFTEHYSLKFY